MHFCCKVGGPVFRGNTVIHLQPINRNLTFNNFLPQIFYVILKWKVNVESIHVINDKIQKRIENKKLKTVMFQGFFKYITSAGRKRYWHGYDKLSNKKIYP